MATFNFNSNRISKLENKLQEYQSQRDKDDESEDDDRDTFLGILKDACSLVRDVGFAPDSKELVDRVDKLLNDAISYAYGDGNLYDFMPSFAHSDSDASPVLKGKLSLQEGVFAHGQLEMFLPFLNIVMGKEPTDPFVPPPEMPPIKTPDPWSESMKPHPSTTHLARFRDNVVFSAPADKPLANIIYQARCEIRSKNICSPVGLSMSANGKCLVLSAMGGWKNRAPVLQYFFTDQPTEYLPKSHKVDVGLSDIAYWTTTDEERKLIFAADRDRIKSYQWGPAFGESYKRGIPTHTMDSASHSGPLTVLSGGRLIRGGKGSVALWSMDSLPTHGTKGKKPIGSKIDTEETWRDDPEDIEASQGSPAHTSIKLEESNLSVHEWHAHPSLAGNMIVGSDPQSTHMYSCVAVDLEHDGKTVAKYLGHGADLSVITTSPGYSSTFMTACNDGYARLYDIRRPLPVLTLDSGRCGEGCPAVIMVHPDGIPTVFTGAESKEQIKMWDIRARQAVYELSTGNNSVVDMAWDAAHNSLYAVTECAYMDRMGYTNDYRRAKVPRKQRDPEDEMEYDNDDDDYEGRCWPNRAYHGEDYFGYMFDAGDHMIYRYAFKENADATVLPPYGCATLKSAPYW